MLEKPPWYGGGRAGATAAEVGHSTLQSPSCRAELQRTWHPDGHPTYAHRVAEAGPEREIYGKCMETDVWKRKGRTMTGSHSFCSPVLCPALPRPLAAVADSCCPSSLCLSQRSPHKHSFRCDEGGHTAWHLPSTATTCTAPADPLKPCPRWDTSSTSLLPQETVGVRSCW